MEKAIERERVLLQHLGPSSSSHSFEALSLIQASRNWLSKLPKIPPLLCTKCIKLSPNVSLASGFINLLNSQNPHPSTSVDELGASDVSVFGSEWAQDAQFVTDRKERRKWTPTEDLVLISAWLNTSKDPVIVFAQPESNRSSQVDFTYSTDMSSNLGNMMSVRNRVRDKTIHQQLKADLVEHI
uniref:Myb-like domain-containing protein n=1 Tax=Brassica oleracea var. oleracea TaxID=109376 RepID=A0A0D3C5R2_BRAOL